VTPHGHRRRFDHPQRCARCGQDRFTFNAEHHPKYSHQCKTCGDWFDAGVYSTECLKCRGLHASARAWQTRRKKYDWTEDRDALLRRRYDSRIKGRVAELARALGWPGWVIKKRAIQIGVATKVMHRIDWTPEQLAVLEEWTGARTSRWIAKRLSRLFGREFSELCVINKQKRMEWSRRVQGDSMTMGELERALGTDHRIIAGWVQSGKLRCHRRKSDRTPQQGGLTYEFDEDHVLRFIRDYRTLIRLDKVEPEWFLGLVLDGAASHHRPAPAVREDVA